MGIRLSNTISKKILEGMGIDPNYVFGLKIELMANSVPVVHILRWIKTEELPNELWKQLGKDPELTLIDEQWKANTRSIARGIIERQREQE